MILHRCFGMVAAMLLLSTAARAADYRLTIAFDKTNPATPLIGEAFAKHLETASKGRMKIQINGPETVPSFEQLQPVAAGVFDFGLTTGGYHAGMITAATTLDGMNAGQGTKGHREEWEDCRVSRRSQSDLHPDRLQNAVGG